MTTTIVCSSQVLLRKLEQVRHQIGIDITIEGDKMMIESTPGYIQIEKEEQIDFVGNYSWWSVKSLTKLLMAISEQPITIQFDDHITIKEILV